MDSVREQNHSLLIDQKLTGSPDILIQVASMETSLLNSWSFSIRTEENHSCRVCLDLLVIPTYTYMESNIQPSSIKMIWRITAHWSSFTKIIFFDIGFGEFLNDTIEESPFSLSWRFCGEKLTSSERYHTSVYHDANCCKMKFLTLLFYYSGVPSLI